MFKKIKKIFNQKSILKNIYKKTINDEIVWEKHEKIYGQNYTTQRYTSEYNDAKLKIEYNKFLNYDVYDIYINNERFFSKYVKYYVEKIFYNFEDENYIKKLKTIKEQLSEKRINHA